MHHGIDGGTAMIVSVFETHIETAFIGDLRRSPFFFTKRKIIVHRSVKIGDEFLCVCALIGDQRTDPLNLSVKDTIIFSYAIKTNVLLLLLW